MLGRALEGALGRRPLGRRTLGDGTLGRRRTLGDGAPVCSSRRVMMIPRRTLIELSLGFLLDIGSGGMGALASSLGSVLEFVRVLE